MVRAKPRRRKEAAPFGEAAPTPGIAPIAGQTGMNGPSAKQNIFAPSRLRANHSNVDCKSNIRINRQFETGKQRNRLNNRVGIAGIAIRNPIIIAVRFADTHGIEQTLG